jgi:hypothetical protein
MLKITSEMDSACMKRYPGEKQALKIDVKIGTF